MVLVLNSIIVSIVNVLQSLQYQMLYVSQHILMSCVPTVPLDQPTKYESIAIFNSLYRP